MLQPPPARLDSAEISSMAAPDSSASAPTVQTPGETYLGAILDQSASSATLIEADKDLKGDLEVLQLAELPDGTPPPGMHGVAAAEDFPEGGRDAVLAVLGGWLIIGSTFGLSNVYAVLNTYFQANQLKDYPPSQIALIGSVHLAVIFGSGLTSGSLFDRGWFRWTMAAGTLLWLVGVFALSLASTWVGFFLSYSICMGLGLGLLFAPTLSCVGTYFLRKRVLMLGIVASGASVVAVIFPILLNSLFPKLGFGNSIRVIAYTQAVMLGVANFITTPRILPNKAAPTPSLVLIRSFVGQRQTWEVGGGVFLVMLGLFVPLFFFQSYAQENGATPTIINYGLGIINAAATVSRVAVGVCADRFGILNTAIPIALISGCLSFSIFFSEGNRELLFCLLYGFFSGAWVTIFTPAFMSLASSPREIGTRAGLGFLFVSAATLSGSPIAGALLTKTGSYVAPICFGGGAMCCGAALLTVARRTQIQYKGGWKV